MQMCWQIYLALYGLQCPSVIKITVKALYYETQHYTTQYYSVFLATYCTMTLCFDILCDIFFNILYYGMLLVTYFFWHSIVWPIFSSIPYYDTQGKYFKMHVFSNTLYYDIFFASFFEFCIVLYNTYILTHFVRHTNNDIIFCYTLLGSGFSDVLFYDTFFRHTTLRYIFASYNTMIDFCQHTILWQFFWHTYTMACF